MSAFIVGHETINKILTQFFSDTRKDEFLRRRMAEMGVPFIGTDNLAQAMLDLNIEAVNQRYDEINDSDRIFYSPYPVSKVQSYKALQCWLYQCSEGNVPQTPLYKFFDEVYVHYLANQIIYSLPEYDRAYWG